MALNELENLTITGPHIVLKRLYVSLQISALCVKFYMFAVVTFKVKCIRFWEIQMCHQINRVYTMYIYIHLNNWCIRQCRH